MCLGSDNNSRCACESESSFNDKRFVAATVVGACLLAALGIRLLILVGTPFFVYPICVFFIVPLGFCLFIASAGLVSLGAFTCQVIWHFIPPLLQMRAAELPAVRGTRKEPRKNLKLVKGGVLGCVGLFAAAQFHGSDEPSIPHAMQEASNLKGRYISHLQTVEAHLASLSNLATDLGSSELSGRGTNHLPEFLAILTQARATLVAVDGLMASQAAYESAIQTEASRLRTASDEMASKAHNAETRDAKEGYGELSQVANRLASAWEAELTQAAKERELLSSNHQYVRELVAFLEDAHRVMSVASEVELPSESHMSGALEQVKKLRTGVSRTLGILRELNSKMSGDILSSPPSEALEDDTT